MARPEKNLLEPLPDDPEHVPGRYAAIDVSPEPMFGPDQLGDLVREIETLTDSANRTDSSSRIFEILQRWEARLFSRGYQFLTSSKNGLGLYGGDGSATPSSIMAANNAMKLFPVNVYGAREDKIVTAGSREVPDLKFGPKDEDNPSDQSDADESNNYLKIWLIDSGIKGVVARIWRYFYTDETAILWTRSVADQQRWGTEIAEKDDVYGAGEDDGVTPETELEGGTGGGSGEDGNEPETADDDSEMPAICELTTAHGVLESKRPIYADDISGMGYLRLAWEEDVDILKERYPWIQDKIEAGQSCAGSSDQYDRMARINVRLAVQSSTASGETFLSDATETHTWYRPSKYRMIKDKTRRQTFYDNFPKGLRVTHAGSELAFVRNESMDDHLAIVHSKEGDGQNRRPIGGNYLPLQKILNQHIGLVVRYFVACIPRRFVDTSVLDVDAINQQSNDPKNITGVQLGAGQTIDQVTGIEKVPQPTTGLMEFVQWLVSGAPEVMDGATPAMFGGSDTGTVGEAELNSDQARGVYSGAWAQTCYGLATAATQAAKCAAVNRKTDIRSRTPGQSKLQAQLKNLKGRAMCYPASLELPATLAEQEAKMASLVEQSANVELYKAIVSDPENLPYMSRMPILSKLRIPGLDAVEKQQGEFDLLLETGPVQNPELLQAQQTIQQLTELQQRAAADPEAQTPEGQQALAQISQQLQALQQQVTTLPPLVSTVPVAQDGSENHMIEAAITLGKMNSPEGRKLKHGDTDQQQKFQNLKLHWSEHAAMAKKLTPVPPLLPKVSVTAALDKAPPEVQSQGWAALGIQAGPDVFTSQDQLVPHEVTVEKEGVDANGVPVKQKISTVNPGGKLN